MNYKIFLFIIFISALSCAEQTKKINYSKKFKNYSNKGFALVYDEKLFKNKFINKKLNDRSLLIFNNVLEMETPIRVTNLINGKYLIAKVGKNAVYPLFYNSVVSKRIASELEIDLNEPYIEVKTLNQKNSFIIAKAKTFDEEKEVADKVPVEKINIKNIAINENKTKLVTNKSKSKVSFKYIIKIADFFFESSAEILKNRLLNEHNISNLKIKKMSKNSYRIYKGPFNNLDSIKREYTDIIKLNFENIEIIKL
jgi:hypothetical protein